MVTESTESRAMNGGDGLYSYTQNSTIQRQGLEALMPIIQEAILDNLDIEQIINSSKSFNIVDLGCSVGSNTIMIVEHVIKVVKLKQKSYLDQYKDHKNLEFQVFFNDLSSNDFNFLFKSLSTDKEYFVAGVPGPFQGRLFPKSSINFFHSSAALHWLSNAPKELTDENSIAYNKGRIHYNNSGHDVFEAYSNQFAKGFESFLSARSIELVNGGLMTLNIACMEDQIFPSDCALFSSMDVLESCLLDLVKMGSISEHELDSFNMPIYFPTSAELVSLIKSNTLFDIKKMERLSVPKNPVTTLQAQQWALHLRAGYEGVIKNHFGDDLSNQVFDMFAKRYVESSADANHSENMKMIRFVIVLERKFG